MEDEMTKERAIEKLQLRIEHRKKNLEELPLPDDARAKMEEWQEIDALAIESLMGIEALKTKE